MCHKYIRDGFTRRFDWRQSDQLARSDRSHDGLLLFSSLAGHGGDASRDDRSGPHHQGPPGTQTLIVGSASIADLTLLKHGATMIVTGKGFGETNFIALDGDGSPLLQSLIRVVGGKNALLVQRGLDRQSYSCAPQCLPTAKLGDDLKYFGEISGQVKDHNAQATGLQ
jgi:hypothetical protein